MFCTFFLYLSNQYFPFKVCNTDCSMYGNDKKKFQQFKVGGLRVKYSINIGIYSSYTFVDIYVALNVEHLKKCMYFRIPIIAFFMLTLLKIITQLMYSFQWYKNGFLILCFHSEE